MSGVPTLGTDPPVPQAPPTTCIASTFAVFLSFQLAHRPSNMFLRFFHCVAQILLLRSLHGLYFCLCASSWSQVLSHAKTAKSNTLRALRPSGAVQTCSRDFPSLKYETREPLPNHGCCLNLVLAPISPNCALISSLQTSR